MLNPLLLSVALAAAPLSTVAEQSDFVRTGRYDEVERLCPAFASAYPGKVKCERYGTSPEGRPLLALAASADGVLEPGQAKAKGRAVILFQGGIHAGEIDGKDAGFWLLRDLLDGKVLPGVLAKVTAVFVPVVNVDGHERFGPHNRPNQVGPAEMGWRTDALNLNVNRDYAKLDCPELRDLVAFLNAWDPIVYLDLHVTDGAEFQHDVGVMVEPRLAGPAALRPLGKAMSDGTLAALVAKKHLPLDFYPAFQKNDDPASGFAVGVPPPRFSNGYWPLHNRFGVLVETHSWKPYKHRVRTTYDVLVAVLERASADATKWLDAAKRADEEAKKLGGTELPIAYDHGAHMRDFEFKGYAWRREPSEISGAVRTSYDPKKPQTFKVPLVDELKVAATARAPKSGYVVPAAYAGWVAEKLKAHGVAFERVEKARPAVLVEAFRATEAKFKPDSYEGRQGVEWKGSWGQEQQDVGAGSVFVPIAQPASALVVNLFEPTARDSFAAWGFFNAALEQKEYMEDYVAEDVARQMLAKDPALAAEFTKRLDSDPAFAKDPAARLAFFYQRHPSYDARYRRYPVVRVESW